MAREIRECEMTSHNKHAVYNATDKGHERRVKHRDTDPYTETRSRENTRRKDTRVEQYLNRPFMAWDGEGVTELDGSHTYVLLAASNGVTLRNEKGIPTALILQTFLDSQPPTNKPINVVYGGGYDVNMILRDVDRDSLQTLYDTGMVIWEGFRIRWRAGKVFWIEKHERTFMLYDVLPFFQTTFIRACDEYLGNDWECRDEIIAEKARRNAFAYKDIDDISRYNRAELTNLIRLCESLRERLFKVGLRIARWDGPGAIAATLLKRYDVKSCLGVIPKDVSVAGRYAYAGGRFEIIRKGHSINGAFQYDIRSAYPAAIRFLPCLSHGEWRHVNRPTTIAPFGVYRVELASLTHMTQPQPLWKRNRNGTVYFSECVHNWYWSPEAQVAIETPNTEIFEGWEYETSCACEPFSFVEPLYRKRAALKRAGDGAHVGLKLGLNSLYGKLAQQIGWRRDDDGTLHIPPYHCLEWAGYVTSHCRAKVFRASQLAPDDVIAFETDAIFSRVRLPLTLGEGLGEWDETEYASLTYLKSGMYYATTPDGRDVERMRGINRGSITRQNVINALNTQGTLVASQTRFITLGQALSQDFGLWRRWITKPRLIPTWLDGKRMDLIDRDDIQKQTGDGWTETQEGFRGDYDDISTPYSVEWINPETTIRDLDGRGLAEHRALDAHDIGMGEW